MVNDRQILISKVLNFGTKTLIGPIHRKEPTFLLRKHTWCRSSSPMKTRFGVLSRNISPSFHRDSKVGSVFPMVFVSILRQAEFGPNDHQEDASHFGNRMILNYKLSKCCGQYPKRNPFDTTRSECCEDSTIKPLGTC